jgi:hypothetical protein
VNARVGWLAAGAIAFLAGTALGWNGGVLDVVARPPALLRAGLVGAAVVTGLWLLVLAFRGIEAGRAIVSAELSARNFATMVRGVRYVFLAVAAFSAAIGWLLGHPLPFIAALLIAGVDVLETSFLLLVVALRREA